MCIQGIEQIHPLTPADRYDICLYEEDDSMDIDL